MSALHYFSCAMMRLRLCVADRNILKSANQPFKKINLINKSEDKVTQIPCKAVALVFLTGHFYITLHYTHSII